LIDLEAKFDYNPRRLEVIVRPICATFRNKLFMLWLT